MQTHRPGGTGRSGAVSVIAALVAAVISAGSLVGLIGAAAGADVGTGRWATVDPADVAAGDWVSVQAGGFSAGSLALVETCATQPRSIVPGQEPQAECEPGTAVNVPVPSSGTIATRLHVVPPTGGCPCFVRIRSTSRPEEAAAPIGVDGVPGAVPGGLGSEAPGSVQVGGPAEAVDAGDTGADPSADQAVLGSQGQVRVLGAVLAGGDSWGTWFGGGAQRTLVLTVENSGTAPVEDPVLHLTAGRSANPSDAVDAPSIGALAPGERRRVTVPVHFDGVAFGSYSVVGRVEVDGTTTEFAASTTTYPWGLVIVPLVVLVEVVLIGGRNRLRRRIHATPPPVPLEELVVGAVDAPDSGVPTGPPAVATPEPAVDLDRLVAAAVAGAFDDRTGSGPAPVDVAPIVSQVVARTAPVPPPTEHSRGDRPPMDPLETEEQPRTLVPAGPIGDRPPSGDDAPGGDR